MSMYDKSIKEFKRAVRRNPNITKQEWDKYASDNMLYSSLVLEDKKYVKSFKELKALYDWQIFPFI